VKIKLKDTLERSKNLSRSNLIFIFGIIKGASVAIAVTIFLQLFINLGSIWSWNRIWQSLPIFVLWADSFICLVITYDAVFFSTIFMFHMPKKSESAFTFLLVGTESLQFAILSPEILNLKNNGMIMSVFAFDWWYAILAFYLFFMFCLFFGSMLKIKKTIIEVDKKCQVLIKNYLMSINIALILIIIFVLMAISTFFLLAFTNKLHIDRLYTYRLISSLFFFISAICVFFTQHNYRSKFERKINEISNKL